MELIDVWRILFALIAVLGLIGICAFTARKTGLSAGGISFGKTRRLALVETMNVDARRRLAIIRCDDREFLLLLGSQNETVVSSELPVRTDTQIPVDAQAKDTTAIRGANPFAAIYAAARAQSKSDAA